ncbi:MAG: hypothetical protein V1663_05750 [archaeon]
MLYTPDYIGSEDLDELREYKDLAKYEGLRVLVKTIELRHYREEQDLFTVQYEGTFILAMDHNDNPSISLELDKPSDRLGKNPSYITFHGNKRAILDIIVKETKEIIFSNTVENYKELFKK